MRPSAPSSSIVAAAEAVQTVRPARPVPRGRWWLAVAILAVVVPIVYRTAFRAGFVFDDHVRIVAAETSIDRLWPPDGWLTGTQRPVVGFTLAVNHAVGGLDPVGYHVLNVGIHVLASLLVLAVVVAAGRRLQNRGLIGLSERGLAIVAPSIALLWALHPIQTATTTYVIQRAESLATLFGLLAIWGLLRAIAEPERRRWLVLVVSSVVLALAAKPTAVTLPVMLYAIDVAIGTGSPRASWRDRRGLWIGTAMATVATLIATGAISGLLFADGRRSGAGVGVVGVGPLEYVASQVRAIGLYARLLVDPNVMSIDHGESALRPVWTLVVGVGVLLGVFATIVVGGLRRAWWTVLPVLVVLAMLPTTSVVPLADPVADHRLHPALLPVVVGVVIGLLAIVRGVDRVRPALATQLSGWSVVSLVATLVICAVAVDRRNHDYVDPALLWSDVVERRPDDVRGLVNRAAVALEEGRNEDAARDLAAADAIEPGNPVVILNLALLDVRFDRPEAALERLAVVEKSRPRDPVLHLARGDAFRMVGRNAEAIEAYEIGAELQPGDPLVRLSLGNALASLERLDEAADAFHEAAGLAEAPAMVASALYNEGNMRFRQERFAEAIEAYEAALAADPSHAGARRWLQEARALDGE